MKIRDSLSRLITQKDKMKISGLGVGEKSAILSCCERSVYICPDFAEAGKIKRALLAIGKQVEIISATRERTSKIDRNLKDYASAVSRYEAGQVDCLIFLPASALTLFDVAAMQEEIIVKKGDDFGRDNLIEALTRAGYERSGLVAEGGQFAARGDIVDVFLSGEEKPFRVDFFDEKIESIHSFELLTMKNIESINQFSISVCQLAQGKGDVFDLDGLHIVSEKTKVLSEMNLLIESYKKMSSFVAEDYAQAEDLLSKAEVEIENFTTIADYENKRVPQRSYLTDFLALKDDVLQLAKENAVVLFCGNEKNKARLTQFFNENFISVKDYDDEPFLPKSIYVSCKNFPFSFSFLSEKIVAIGSENLFKVGGVVSSQGTRGVFYLPKLGDYVVHNYHGIGKCIKIERMQLGDVEKDYFVIEYKNGGMLYLPSEEAGSLSAFVGGEKEPKLSTLGGGEFSRLKERVKSSLKEMAFSLAEVYKAREEKKGFVFERDELLEDQFAQAFEFPLTEDQAKAIADIDKDMESPKIMDRLICGDVGFGKTEVALRAAFKCAYNGKQVCFMCPTTILSEQHYRTASARLAPFGVRVEVLNRFKSATQVADILKRLKEGNIDVLIGTHIVLGKNVEFKDLGLLILDEEQRFGVEHKEKIKNSRKSVDALSMSATPIPRTLSMSLSGIRDISIIETPPKERLPIQTYVTEESDQLVQDVISRELYRGGQTFVVYNRVESIEQFAARLRTLLPQAKIGVAHGQMDKRLLESVIDRLYKGEFDVLISTTLIENGVDLPSANTLIVIDADMLGLGQLYQLRGRIGRSDKLGYAYLTYNPRKILGDEASLRLDAIKEFSALGSGFKIAMRDLEIRGAGNLFGKEQHGHIAKVGYDMFVKLLEEATSEIQGKNTGLEEDIKLEIALSAFISEAFVPSSEERIGLYAKISTVSSTSQMLSLKQSIKDAYGATTAEIDNLMYIALLKNLAKGFGITKIKISASVCQLYLASRTDIVDERLAKAAQDYGGRLNFDGQTKLSFQIEGGCKAKLMRLIELFSSLSGSNLQSK